MIHILDLKFQGYEKAIAAFIVETSAGPVLVETGPHSTFENLRNQIASKGFKIEEIKHVHHDKCTDVAEKQLGGKDVVGIDNLDEHLFRLMYSVGLPPERLNEILDFHKDAGTL